MKKLSLALAIALGLSVPSLAIQNFSESVYQSSFTATNDTGVVISTAPRTELFGVAVSSISPGGLLTLYDGWQVARSTIIAQVFLGTVQNPQFLVQVSSGLVYTTTLNAGGVTIVYRNPLKP